MDRREFLKISGATAAGIAAASIPSTLKAENKKEGKVVRNFPEAGLLGYGCMRWPQIYNDEGKQVIFQDAVNDLVDRALECGVNYFDTAPVYLKGESEKATAIALNRHPREEWLLATKLSNFKNWTLDNSKKLYRRSLSTFQTDHIDYYLLHSISDLGDFETRFGKTGIMNFLLAERKAGHIRNLGFSFHGNNAAFDDMLALHPKYHWDFVQIEMNYKEWEREGNAKYLYEALTALNIPVIIMEPLLGGGLATLPSHLAQKLKSAEPDRSVASWAFRFCGSFPNVLTVLSGMTYMEHLEDNLKTFSDFKPLSTEEFSLLDSVAMEISKYPLIGCTGCQYCMPCPYGIDIPGIFRFWNKTVNEGTYVVSDEQKGYARARRRYIALYDKSVEKLRQADHCISCGKCLKACPQHIRIPKQLERIDKYVESLKRETGDFDPSK